MKGRLIAFILLVVSCVGCAGFRGGTVGVPELQPGDRITIEYNRHKERGFAGFEVILIMLLLAALYVEWLGTWVIVPF